MTGAGCCRLCVLDARADVLDGRVKVELQLVPGVVGLEMDCAPHPRAAVAPLLDVDAVVGALLIAPAVVVGFFRSTRPPS